MHIVSIALGGCLKAEPVRYGITEDTGGHISYILGEMQALAERPDVSQAEIVTRLFDVPDLDPVHSVRYERVTDKLSITRIDSGNRDYLAKDALSADRTAFADALVAELRGRAQLPDIIHAHFADAADVAARVERALGIPFVYTAHSLGKDKATALGGELTAGYRARIAEEGCAIAGASAIIGSSRDECERQIPAYRDDAVGKTHRIVPGVCPPLQSAAALDAARSLIAPFLRNPNKPILLAIARPVHKKNLARLVDAFGSSAMLRDRCNLVLLAGLRDVAPLPGSEQAEVLHDLFTAIDRHDLYGSVAYPKSHTRDEVSGLYRLAAQSGGLFVNPALMEPYGLTLIEAASYGLPVVATKVGGPLDIIDELEHGALIEPTSVEDIRTTMERIMDDRSMWARYARNGSANVQSMSWSAYASAFMAIARSIVDDAPQTLKSDFRHLVVSDIDNTLTGCTIGAARFAGFFTRRRDFAFAVATGRSLVEARRLVRDWGLPRPTAWITSVGSEIYWDRDGELEPDAAFAEIIAQGWNADAIEHACNDIPGLVPQAVYEQRRFKRSYLAETPQVAERVRERLADLGLQARVIFSHENLLDILPVRAGKGAAMCFVADTLGVARSAVFAAGDSGNDEDMLTACDNAILVGNHSEEVAALRDQPNVYVARRSFGAGALEGVLSHRRTRRKRAIGGLGL